MPTLPAAAQDAAARFATVNGRSLLPTEQLASLAEDRKSIAAASEKARTALDQVTAEIAAHHAAPNGEAAADALLQGADVVAAREAEIEALEARATELRAGVATLGQRDAAAAAETERVRAAIQSGIREASEPLADGLATDAGRIVLNLTQAYVDASAIADATGNGRAAGLRDDLAKALKAVGGSEWLDVDRRARAPSDCLQTTLAPVAATLRHLDRELPVAVDFPS